MRWDRAKNGSLKLTSIILASSLKCYNHKDRNPHAVKNCDPNTKFCYVKKKESDGKVDRDCAKHEDIRIFHSIHEKGIYPLHDGCLICREKYCPVFGGLKYNEAFCICNSNQCNYDCR